MKTAEAIVIGMITLLILAMVAAVPFWFLWNNAVTAAVPFCGKINFFQAIGLLLFTLFLRIQPSIKVTKND